MQATRKVNFLRPMAIIPARQCLLFTLTDELLDFLLMHFGFFRLFAAGAEGIKPGTDQENDGRQSGNAD